ncbi:MAG: Crp/Fnr family transcriptional regulator [Schleiferiaceae bacterium]|nr:Crp/Fnr family transcriptional regulator [Schleiferiaceae bacterium]
MNSGEKAAMRNYFESLPVYSEFFDEAIDAVISAMDSTIRAEKGRVLNELGAKNRDFWFLKDGYLKEMYRSPYAKEDGLFNMIPPSSIFVNEDTLFANQRPLHYFTAYTSVEILRLSEENYSRLLREYPIINLLYISGTAEIQKSRRARLNMLRMNKTPERIEWVQQQRRELFQIMDRITLAQYIGVSRASLYRAFEKNNKYQY